MSSSMSLVCRQAARYVASSATSVPNVVRSQRAFGTAVALRAAQNFVMPAMSPTMTEGNIASWKVKEGDSFSAGDVLLEIETDKAQMDVEAQEDGVLAKIMQQDGSKGVKVGARIAVLAEQSDDLSSIEIPADEAPSSSPAANTASDKPNEPEKQPEKESARGSSSGQSTVSSDPQSSGPSHSKKYPLYPAVQHLLRTNGVSESDISTIRATGPQGRLLKGDVLAYLGEISKSYPAEQSARITQLGHLDLSNIKLAAPKPATTDSREIDVTKSAAALEADQETEVAVPVSLDAVLATQKRIQDTLGLTLPLSTFIARASALANEDLPRPTGSVSADELFDAVLGLDRIAHKPTVSRGHYAPNVTVLGPSTLASRASRGISSHKSDIIDELSGQTSRTTRLRSSRKVPGATGIASGNGGAVNVFSVNAKKGEEARARTYLERIKTTLELDPGQCVL